MWFGTAEPPREHYEAQVVGARDVPETEVLAIEIGFHSETWPDPDLSDPDLGMEIAARPADYLDAIEPLR